MYIFLIGKPGVGKGTISQYLVEKYDFIQLSTGELLREEAKKNTPLGIQLRELTKTSKFASDKDIFYLVHKFLDENKDKNIIFDGFPRNVAQLNFCINNFLEFDYIFDLEHNNDLKLEERIIGRRVHQPSGRVYNVFTNPPLQEGVDDITQEPLAQRHDDKPEIFKERLELFYKNTQPILEKLNDADIDVIHINAESALQDLYDLVDVLISSHLAQKNHVEEHIVNQTFKF